MAEQTIQRGSMKIMQKNYHLVNQKTGEKVVVHPPRLPGLKQDFVDPKNEKGEWIRVFSIVEGAGRQFRRGKDVVLYHAPGETPYCMIGNEKWEIEPIEGVHAIKKRGEQRKGFRSVATVVKRGSGRPRKEQNEEQQPQQKGPGRPRKEPQNPTTAPKQTKRGPGRPRKETEEVKA